MFIYKILNLLDGKVYIGKCESKSLTNRWSKHIRDLRNKKHHNCYLQNAWHKYGNNNFLFEIIERDIFDFEKLRKMETHYINEYKSFNRDFGYNLTYGGEGGAFYLSDESKRKIGNANRGRKMPQEAIEKTRQFNLNRKLSEEHKRKISVSTSGEKNGFYGKKHNAKVKKLVSISNKNRTGSRYFLYHFINDSGEEIILDDVGNFANSLGLTRNYIYCKMSGHKPFKGFVYLGKEKKNEKFIHLKLHRSIIN